ncbi:hypothetical protein AKJ41_03345 [candidate division MSBL1 archaeon SCGC-AAA259O05]|uniref:Uncharacterized protein n=1 Tax=candidate division MSBL1 archaeon SCGC-AAA259O05 TaxID=1698271 RepID=A0A133V3C9_9EURY|nr:hypothetical protein AKJ41_03345 [candidate division MSBL1 archaeon SCGC-AAA259O05]
MKPEVFAHEMAWGAAYMSFTSLLGLFLASGFLSFNINLLYLWLATAACTSVVWAYTVKKDRDGDLPAISGRFMENYRRLAGLAWTSTGIFASTTALMLLRVKIEILAGSLFLGFLLFAVVMVGVKRVFR